ncbi:molybdenum cofactor guanylyltransferase [Sphingobium sp. AP50]|uniref:molybdenum cofactor guanylyltransferase n=1 Tax=Sphingobium sp. AP50 TaxID=1884369 RepID=UPI000B88AE94|nr:molybdenum cofactor guanylyltransferase [Sphingobium sp. AP50]
MRVLGAVLAGGRSRRFGRDKALATLGGRSLMARSQDLISGWTQALVICGREPGLADRPAPDQGPLGGLNAALHHGRSNGYDAVLSIPCDTPVVPNDAFAILLGMGTSSYLVGCPVIGLWSCDLADELDTFLASGRRSMRDWAARADARPVDYARKIPNVNTAADLLWLMVDHS